VAKLLREYVSLSYDKKLIKEAREQNKPVIVSGILQKADVLNQNRRVYPRSVLEREMRNYEKVVSENRAVGTLDHEDSSVISLENVSHVIRRVWWDGGDVKGDIELLNTPKGKIAQDLLEAGVVFGISSRGLGETQKSNEGYDLVSEDFMLICFDLVQEPSTPGAWMHLRESKNIDVGNVIKSLPKTYKINRILNEILRG